MGKSGRIVDKAFRFLTPKRKENWKIIILCFLGAATFWFFNSLNKNYSTKINYPIVFDYEHDSTIIIGSLPSKIRIDVSSGGWNILRKSLGFDVDPAIIPLEKPTETKKISSNTLLPIISEQVGEIKVNYVADDTLFINIEKQEKKLVPVVLDTTGLQLEEEFEITSEFTVNPDSVILYAPSSMVDSIPLFTVSYNRKGIKNSISESVRIPIEYPEYMQTAPSSVKINFEVKRFVRQEMAFAIDFKNFPKSFNADSLDNKIKLIFRVQEDSVPALNQNSFHIVADYNNMNFSDSTLIPRILSKPDFVRDIYVNSPQISF